MKPFVTLTRNDLKAKQDSKKTPDNLELEDMNKQLYYRVNGEIVGTYLMVGEADEVIKTLNFLDRKKEEQQATWPDKQTESGDLPTGWRNRPGCENCKLPRKNFHEVFSHSFTSLIYGDTYLTNQIDFDEVMEAHN